MPHEEPILIDGFVARGYEAVADVFIENFARRGERGAACAAYVRGKKVVDLWGGYSHYGRRIPWREDTVVPVFSTTKGVASMAMALAHARGWFEYDDPIASYWPGFGQAGKEAISIRQLLSHQAGLPALDIPLDDILHDPDAMEAALAAQKPHWTPGDHHGYHSSSLGWYESALLRQLDPARRTLGQFLQQEVMAPLGEEFYIGLPLDFPDEGLAFIEAPRLSRMLFHLDKLPWSFVKAFMNPFSLSYKTIKNPRVLQDPKNINDRGFLSLEVPAVNGVGRVRSIARLYGELAVGGEALGLDEETFRALCAPATPPRKGSFDLVLRSELAYSLGYIKRNPTFPFCDNPRAFGTPGAGGSLGFADPDRQLGFAYAPTQMSFYLFGDPREALLRDAVYRCL